MLAAICALAIIPSMASQGTMLPDTLRLDRIGTERGLPSETINTLTMDRYGFLWIGTRAGLAMYDGYSTRVYQYITDDTESLSDNDVRAILEDNAGRLWVGTTTGGLNVLDRATGRFRRFLHDPDDPASVSNNAVFALYQDRAGEIWVGTHNGLNRLNPATGRIQRYLPDPGTAGSLPGQWVMALHEDRDGYLWIATVGAGIARLDPERERFERFLAGSADAASNEDVTYALAEDREGVVWIGAVTGVYRFDSDQGLFIKAPVRDLETTSAEPPIVTSIDFDDNGILWIATWTQGVVAYNPASGESRGYRHDPAQRTSLGTNRIPRVQVHGDDIWLGTWGSGIHRFSAISGVFADIEHLGVGGPDLDNTEVTSVLEDRTGGIWLGTLVDGLFNYRPDGRWRQFLSMPDGSGRIGTVFSLAETADGLIWIGTNGSLLRFARSGAPLEIVDGWPDRPNGIRPEAVTAMAVDHLQRLWIGLTDGSLYQASEGGRHFIRYGGNLTGSENPGGTSVSTIYEDPDGFLWIGTRSGGMNRFEPDTGRFQRFHPVHDHPASLSHHHVSSIFRGSDGVLSVGTVGGGLDRMVSSDIPGTFEHLSLSGGLVDQNVMSILEDDDRSLWIATRQGLSRYQPETGQIRNYLLGDGIRSLKFNERASSQCRDFLLFGTLNGPVAIRRGTRFVPPPSSPIRIVEIGIGGKPWQGATAPWSTERIKIDYGDQLSLEFAVLDYRSRSRFRYRLGEDQEPWADLGENRILTFAELAPGSHLLEVQGRNAHGVWSDSPVILAITVVPPLWMTGWFRGSVAIVLLATAILGYKRRTSVLKRRNLELERLHQARELAMVEVKHNQTELQKAYTHLRALAHRLEEAKEEERGWIARELHDQMGQSLSAAKLDLKALGRLPDSPERDKRLQDALELIDGMIRHIRSLSLDLRPPLLEELGLVMTLRSYAQGQSDRTEIEIAVEANNEASELPPTISIVAFRIVQESVNNVIRHASARTITISVRRRPDSVALTIRDDGCGFDVQAALAQAGRGGQLGLLGMQERVEALGGRLEIRSEIGGGTEIRAVVPLDERG